MEVFFNQETRWEVDEEKLFILYEDDWEEWKETNGDSEHDRELFVYDLLWQMVPHLEEVGGIETYDNARIDVFFAESVKQ